MECHKPCPIAMGLVSNVAAFAHLAQGTKVSSLVTAQTHRIYYLCYCIAQNVVRFRPRLCFGLSLADPSPSEARA